MTPTSTPEPIVTQADREMAADIWRDYIARIGECITEKGMREGGLDEGLPSVLARHREQSTRAADAGQAGLREAVEKIVHENGPIAVDWYGEALAWRPLDYGSWTPFAALSSSAGAGEAEQDCPASPDHADILETIENAAPDWTAQGYPSALAEVRDMANVGRSLIERIADATKCDPLKGWMPADDPVEIVTNLINLLADAKHSSEPAEEAERKAAAQMAGLVEAGQSIIDRMSGTFRARNGRKVGIEGDDGEKCWIVHSDDIETLRQALTNLGQGGEE